MSHSEALRAVARAAKRARAAAAASELHAADYRRAVFEARRAGCTLDAIGDAAGTSRQSVWALLKRAREGGNVANARLDGDAEADS